MKKKLALIIGLCLIAMLTSCSSLVESTRKMIDGDSPRKKAQKSQWVSKAQYDELMLKYKNLTQKYDNLKEQKSEASSGYDQALEMGKSAGTETVDVFGENGLATKVSATLDEVASRVDDKPLTQLEVDQEVKTYKKAVLLSDNGNINESLKVFQYLEKSPTKQIRVRAKLHIGNIYLQKQQYDLALQVFESIINNEAFSGNVLKALEGAISSSQQLGLTDKQLRYQSMLTDVFEVKG